MPFILCGGSGTRLWPLSRAGFPKQLLVLSGTIGLFQQAVVRLNELEASDIKLSETFVTRKITRGLTNIAQGMESCI